MTAIIVDRSLSIPFIIRIYWKMRNKFEIINNLYLFTYFYAIWLCSSFFGELRAHLMKWYECDWELLHWNVPTFRLYCNWISSDETINTFRSQQIIPLAPFHRHERKDYILERNGTIGWCLFFFSLSLYLFCFTRLAFKAELISNKCMYKFWVIYFDWPIFQNQKRFKLYENRSQIKSARKKERNGKTIDRLTRASSAARSNLIQSNDERRISSSLSFSLSLIHSCVQFLF